MDQIQLEIFSEDSYLDQSKNIIPKNDCVNLNKIWAQLTHEAMSILDKFYRDLNEMKANRASPFLINIHHRCYNGYYEFYEMEYEQIFKNYECVKLYREKLTEKEMFEKFGKEVNNERLLEL